MDKNELIKLRNTIYDKLEARQLALAFKSLKIMVDASQQWQLIQDLDQITTSYSFMLQYLAKGVLDPQRNDILAQIVIDSYELTDKTFVSIAASQSTHIFYQRYQQYKDTMLSSIIDQLSIERNKLQLINSVNDDSYNANAASALLRRCETLESDIFNKVWSSFPLSSADIEAINSLLNGDAFPPHLKSLVLSAMMLSLTKFFDAPKLKLLINAYISLNDTELRLRALINAIVIMYLYRNRINDYKELLALINEAQELNDFASDVQLIFTRLINTRNTDNITKKMREGIMPELQKMNPDLFEKIKGKTPGTIDISEIEENPQWQQWLDESGITRKLEEFNEIQIEGGDVFISTFAKLKTFPFFNTLSNWFLPYHDECSVVINAFGGKKHPLINLFKAMPILCDSDKYSMMLSIASAPESQRNMMFQQFNAQQEQFDELRSHDSQAVVKMRDNIANRYIQDLYRFFKLFSRRREFKSIFDFDINLTQVDVLKPFITGTDTLSVIAEFYFKNDFYDDAIKFYRLMIANHDADPHVYQKIAFAFQAMGNYQEAIKNYSRYELVNNNELWNTKQMAQCFRAIHDHDKAIQYYTKALELSPQSVNLCLNLGHCFLDKGDYHNALQHYYKADFMPKAKHRAWRPIAWCSLLTKKLDQAIGYYEKILADDSPSPQDHLNYGHALQVAGRIADAVSQYSLSLSALNNDIEAFTSLYVDDAKYIVKKLGIPATDYALILDAVTQSIIISQ